MRHLLPRTGQVLGNRLCSRPLVSNSLVGHQSQISSIPPPPPPPPPRFCALPAAQGSAVAITQQLQKRSACVSSQLLPDVTAARGQHVSLPTALL